VTQALTLLARAHWSIVAATQAFTAFGAPKVSHNCYDSAEPAGELETRIDG
jgi:hypothetical protein